MTQIASIRSPSNVAVVAGAAKTPFGDVGHPEIIRSYTHLESKFGVANLAAKSNPVKPVRKHHRPHAFFLRSSIEHHVGIFRIGGRDDSEHSKAKQQGNPESHGRRHHLGGTAPGGIAIGRDGLGALPGRGTL